MFRRHFLAICKELVGFFFQKQAAHIEIKNYQLPEDGQELRPKHVEVIINK